MSTAGLSKARLGRMHDVMAGYVERGEVPGIVTLLRRGIVCSRNKTSGSFFVTVISRHSGGVLSLIHSWMRYSSY